MLKFWLVMTCVLLLALTVSALLEALGLGRVLKASSTEPGWRDCVLMTWLAGVGVLGSLALLRALGGLLWP